MTSEDRAGPIALTRAVSRSIDRCELTHRDRVRIDVDRARSEHAAYERVLADAGCRVERLPEAPDHPDAVFVEDTAVVLPHLAIVARPGARSRRGEVATVAERLGALRPLVRLEAPATLDGGDVLALGDTLWVGRSARTNPEGIRQLRAAVAPAGLRVVAVPVERCLHLKSAVTAIAPDTLLIDPSLLSREPFAAHRLVETDPGEPGAANALLVGGVVVYPEEFEATRRRIEALGIDVAPVPASELAKAEGGVTCCSLIVDPP